MSTIHYSNCPVCSSANIHPLFKATDHTVSREEFVVWTCGDCTLRFTQDVPDLESIGSYYKSEDYISHTDTSKGMVNSLYQRVKKYTLQKKASYIFSLSGKKGKALDIGAGTGAFVQTLKEEGWNIEGLEPDEGARQQAKKNYGIELKEMEELNAFPSRSFDVITLWHVLEHVHDLHPYMERLKDLLAEGGYLLIAVPNYTSTDARQFGNYWAAYDVPRHLYHFSPQSIKKLLEIHGLYLKEMKPMWFDSYYISLLSHKYRFNKQGWFNAILWGTISNMNAALHKDRCSSITYVIRKTRD